MSDSLLTPLDDDIPVECPICGAVSSECARCGGTGEVPLQSLTEEERAAQGWFRMPTMQDRFTD